MSAFELAEWRAFMHAEPFGDARADFRHWVACDMLAQVNGNPARPMRDYLPPTLWPDLQHNTESTGTDLRQQLEQEYGG